MTTPVDPLALIREWCGTGYPPAPRLMTVSTIDADGLPDARSLLLSAVDGDARLYFHTDARSRKCAQLDADGSVALTLVWPELGRQLVVAGTAELSGPAESDRAWLVRSPYLRQLGWLNDAELVSRTDDERTAAWLAFADRYAAEIPPRPDWWVGYAVTARRITAWAASAGRGSVRNEYRKRADGVWEHELLPG